MKKLLLLSFLFVSFIGFSQNYQTIKSSEIHYFGNNDSSYFLATRIDSIEINGLDSIFYSFKTIRNNDTSTIDCYRYLGNSWLGKKTIIQNDGKNVFINKDYDSIFVQTQAVVGDTFLFYQYPSLNYINGVVTNIDTLTTLGTLDSVKTIQIYSNEPSFNLSTTQIRIGKNSGFIEFFPFYNFPNKYEKATTYFGASDSLQSSLTLVGEESSNYGITSLSRFDLYNMEIGDIIQFEETYSNDITDKLHVYTNAILSKLIHTQDSISYEIMTTHYYHLYEENFMQPPTIIDTTWTETTWAIHGTLSKKINIALPEEYYSQYGHQTFYTLSTSSQYCGLHQQEFADGSSDIIDTCSTFFLDGSNDVHGYTTGTGIIESYSSHNSGFPWGFTSYKKKVNYFSDSSTTCGTFNDVGISENNRLQTSFYPNPTSSAINYSVNTNEGISISIFNITGKQVFSISQQNNKGSVSLNELSKGIYIIQFSTNNGHSSSQKLIID